ncbi:aspartate/glutamate racemase family protein [Nocardia higoensis]|uniref:aspartate/glutamate racemase family protein n=1 Tax=Nocardia higoensis TaxID=228599 RepID=UPI0002EF142A|nr:aspartate/glutamate racemase family protein [Nocardia higoensis]
MTILVVNPNRIDANTRHVQAAADQWFPDLDVRVVNPLWGPAELPGELEAQLSATGVLDRVLRYDGELTGVVMAGFAEPGVEALRESVPVPVVDITEAGPLTGLLLGRRYGIITSSYGVIPLVEDRLITLGLAGRCAGVVATGLGVPEMMRDRAATADRLVELGQDFLARHTCSALVLGCGGFTGLGEEVSQRLGVAVVEPVRAAIALVLALGSAGIGASAVPATGTAIDDWALPRTARGVRSALP